MSKNVKRMSLGLVKSFTSDQVTSAIKSCRSSRAYGPDTLSIFDLKNLGPLATEHLTALYNVSPKSFRLPSIWKTSLVIPIPKPGKDSSQGTSYRPICYTQLPSPEALMLLSTYSHEHCQWGSPRFPLVVHQPASPSIWPAVQSLRRGLSTNPGVTMWCVCGCS